MLMLRIENIFIKFLRSVLYKNLDQKIVFLVTWLLQKHVMFLIGSKNISMHKNDLNYIIWKESDPFVRYVSFQIKVTKLSQCRCHKMVHGRHIYSAEKDFSYAFISGHKMWPWLKRWLLLFPYSIVSIFLISNYILHPRIPSKTINSILYSGNINQICWTSPQNR